MIFVSHLHFGTDFHSILEILGGVTPLTDTPPPLIFDPGKAKNSPVSCLFLYYLCMKPCQNVEKTTMIHSVNLAKKLRIYYCIFILCPTVHINL